MKTETKTKLMVLVGVLVYLGIYGMIAYGAYARFAQFEPQMLQTFFGATAGITAVYAILGYVSSYRGDRLFPFMISMITLGSLVLTMRDMKDITIPFFLLLNFMPAFFGFNFYGEFVYEKNHPEPRGGHPANG